MRERLQVCAKPNCPVITTRRLCPAHMSEAEKARGTKAERGYGKEFQALRRTWKRAIADGGVRCWRCHKPIAPGQAFDLGHDDDDRRIVRGPEHPNCNRTAGGKAAHQ